MRTARTSNTPEKFVIDLMCADKEFQLFQARERTEFENLLGHRNPLEHFPQLRRTGTRGPSAAETRQLAVDLVEGDAIAAVVAAARAQRDFATRKRVADDLGDLAHTVVVLVVTDVED